MGKTEPPMVWPIDDYFYSGERETAFLGQRVVKQRHTLTQVLMESSTDYAHPSEEIRSRINTARFKTEAQWLKCGFQVDEKRMLTVTLTPENLAFFEGLSFAETIAYLEKLDDDYYAAIPTVEELAKLYGNPDGERYYSARDLYLHYQRRYIADNGIEIYNINDERQYFGRRF